MVEFLAKKPITNTFPVNSLITSYASSNTPETAILAYKRVVQSGFSPDMYTFPVVLKSCGKISGIREGKQFHGVIVKMGFSNELYVQNGLIHFYSVCGECDGSGRLFDEMSVRDVVTWNSLISGYVRAGLFNAGFVIFSKMDVNPNAATFVSVLVACGRLGSFGIGRGVHGLVFKCGFESSLVVGNALIDMYVKCLSLDEAKKVFDEISERDKVSWTCIISGLVQGKNAKEALEYFNAMQKSGTEPDKVTLSSVLSACASLGALEYGKWVHEYINRKGIEWDPYIGMAMVDMYAKCGSKELASITFRGIPCKNIYTWNALLGGLAIHGHGNEVLLHFQEMLDIGTKPNGVTFLAVLNACCHSGLVDEGCRQFNEMSRVYNLTPKIKHYGCMVDLLCRAGLLEEAQELIRSMPMKPDVLILGALLSACKVHGNADISKNILGKLGELECDDSGVYVVLSNIYASNDKWEDVERVRRLMKKKGINKFPGSSVVEVDGKTHEFVVGDNKHSQQEEVYVVLNMLTKHVFLRQESEYNMSSTDEFERKFLH
ncbi:hypothetical protein GIB67_008394 [Kingdonia uniflora]|uniref:Pentatricopeptide repeat-containing protein n=1 Tax=Kingdonia uniflora TaxID=39325 RepID=A0A7J7N542_9MAGN|nr:hypothetical protein GIB67_008394 [Kingdonia uniflora]